MTIAIGTRLGPYEVLSLLGSGGMGEVYRARDTRLGREVAIKVLQEEAVDPERLRRFELEARSASALNHPNIVTVYDVGQEGSRPYLAMELVRGSSLREMLAAGPLSSRSLLELGVQIAGGLARAHAPGIVHRDLKPENIMVTPDGLVKILDFGLAKLGSSALDAGSQVPTAAAELAQTRAGTVLGTVAYMSPEQARGEPLDARSDVFSLGSVLYEMANGRQAFEGPTAAVVFDAILNRSPEPAPNGSPAAPDGLGPIIGRALEKDRDLRYQSAADLLADLKRLARDSGRSSEISPPVGPWPRTRYRRIAAPVLILAVAAGVGLLVKGRLARAPSIRPVSLAVLPFQALGDDRGSDYLRLAIPDEIVTTLSYFPAVAIRPFSQTRAYDRPSVSAQAAGRGLQVAQVLTGHFLRDANRIQVTLEVVDVEENRLVWSETVAAGDQDLIALKDRIVAGLREGLLPRFGGSPGKSPAGSAPRNAQAYAVYLQSIALSRDAASNRQAMTLLERAVALDPGFSPAWRELGGRYYDEAEYAGGGQAFYERARQAAARAVELDPESIEAATNLVQFETEAGHLESADDEAQRLLRQRPDSPITHLSAAYVLRYAGLLDQAARECDAALAIDPKNPQASSCAHTFLQLGQYERALQFVRLVGGSEWSKIVTVDILLRQGRSARALELVEGGARQGDGGTELLIGFLRHHSASEIHRAAVEYPSRCCAVTDPEPKYWVAAILSLCGERRLSLDLLRQAQDGGYIVSSAMDREPFFKDLRNDPEFQAIRATAIARQKRFLAHRGGRRQAA